QGEWRHPFRPLHQGRRARGPHRRRLCGRGAAHRGRGRRTGGGAAGRPMSWRADVITLFPDLFPGPLGASVLGRGMADGIWSLGTTQLRDFASDRHRTVDDTPSGGGAGMVLKPDILAAAIDSLPADRPRILMSPRGTPLTQARVRELAAGPGVIVVCGRFEGI